MPRGHGHSGHGHHNHSGGRRHSRRGWVVYHDCNDAVREFTFSATPTNNHNQRGISGISSARSLRGAWIEVGNILGCDDYDVRNGTEFRVEMTWRGYKHRRNFVIR